jgi:serine phosphatase RsbU (regulator of sigma subunit)
MKKYIALLLIICFSNSTNAQYKFSDFSIIRPPQSFYDTIEMMKTMPESIDKAMLQSRAFTFYFYTNSDSALYYAKNVEAFAKKNDMKAMLIYHHLFIGSQYSTIRGNHALGLYYINLAISETKEFNLSNKFIDGTLTMMQLMSYAGLGSYTKVKNLLPSSGYNGIRNAYVRENVWTPDGMIAQIYGSIKEYDSAIKYAIIAIKINDTVPLQLKWGFPFIVLSDAYLQKKDYNSALAIIYKGANIIRANNYDKDIAESFAISAKAHFGLKNYDSAIYYAKVAFDLSSKIKLTNTILDASLLMSKIFQETNKIDSAYKYLLISNGIKDDISDKTKVNEIENITINEELRQKQKEEDASIRKKLTAGLSILFIIIIVTLTIYNRYKTKEKLRRSEENRKNKELQAAKDLQLSLLPKKNPKREDLDIATFIRSSTEVGGDYYDFDVQKDGTIISICGDATGHGVASGMMVSVTKAGLKGIGNSKPNELLQRLNNVVKDVDLGTLRMSLNVAEVGQNEVQISSAAMPPVYLYKAASNTIEEFMNNGLPLGGLRDEAFELVSRNFETGDVLIQLSDGLPEAPNLKGEPFDYEQLKNLIKNNCHLSAQEIVKTLIQSVDIWMEGKHNPDDITIVIIKKK